MNTDAINRELQEASEDDIDLDSPPWDELAPDITDTNDGNSYKSNGHWPRNLDSPEAAGIVISSGPRDEAWQPTYSIDPPDRNGRRLVCFIDPATGEEKYRDKFDIDAAGQRERFLTKVWELSPGDYQHKNYTAENGSAPDLPEMSAVLLATRDAIDAGEDDEFESLNAAELDAADCSLEFLCENTVVAGLPMGALGAEKSLKSTLINGDLGISLASGTPFLGVHAIPRPITVALFVGEGGRGHVQDYARRKCASIGIKLGDLYDKYHLFSRVPDATSEASLAKFARALDRTGAEFATLDPTYLLMGNQAENASNVFVYGSLYEKAHKIAADRGVTLCFIHHTTKVAGQRYDRAPWISDGQFAGFSQFVGQWILLGRRGPYDEEFPGRHLLWGTCGGRWGDGWGVGLDVNEGSRKDPGGRRWDVEIKSIAECRQEKATEEKQETVSKKVAELEDVGRKILAKMDEAKATGANAATEQGHLTIRKLKGILPHGEDSITRAMERLREQGLVGAELIKPKHSKEVEGFKRKPEDGEQTTFQDIPPGQVTG